MNRSSIVFVAAALCLWCTMAFSQGEQTRYLLTRLGRDTIAIEEYSIGSNGLHGTSVVRSPRTMIRDYSADFDRDGNLETFHVLSHLESGKVLNERDYSYTNDSVHITVRQDSVTRSVVAAAGRPYPLFVNLFGGWEAAIRHALASQRHFGILWGKNVLEFSVVGNPPGAIVLTNSEGEFAPIAVKIAEDGRIENFDLTATTDKFIAEQISPVDVKSLAHQFAEREREGHSLGVLSPRDTVRAEINGAHLLIDYGRPAVRGRTIFGGVVPWDTIWRTGANAATQLITDKDLQFGSTLLPAGTYSIFSIPDKETWVLVINSQHGQWGTDYDKAKDFVRLPLEVKQLDNPVERFTFGIEPQGSEGTLYFEWDRTRAELPFAAK
jgi:hypothetical protein